VRSRAYSTRHAELREPRFAFRIPLVTEHRFSIQKMLRFQELGIFFDATPVPVMRWDSGENVGIQVKMKEDVMRNLLLSAATGAFAPCGGSSLRPGLHGRTLTGPAFRSVRSALVWDRDMTMVGAAMNTMPMAPTVR
jgi:hypothetical protein